MLDVLIRAGLIAVLVFMCFRVFRPFLDLMTWSLILAISLYPLQVRLRHRTGGREGVAATLIVVIALALIVVPTYLMGVAVVESVEHAAGIIKNGQFRIPPPSDAVAGWPLVGKRLHEVWWQAANDLTGLLQGFAPEIKKAGLTLLALAGMVTKGMLMFLFALIVAGIFMAYGEQGHRSAVDWHSPCCCSGSCNCRPRSSRFPWWALCSLPRVRARPPSSSRSTPSLRDLPITC
jgi:predicted PurR-regulated permease PerM